MPNKCHCFFCFILLCGWFLVPISMAEDLPAEQFLAMVREPLRRDVWGEVTGLMVCKREGKENLEGELRIHVTFSPESLCAQIVLNDVNVYGLEQHFDGMNTAKMEMDLPEKEATPGLFEFGIAPSDISFAFIYWNFVEELPRASSRWRECRVLKLADPNGDGYVNVWFNAQHGFPMEAEWYKNGAAQPWRRLEMKGAKRHANGLWFVREMRMEGEDWKTSVRFDFAGLNDIGE